MKTPLIFALIFCIALSLQADGFDADLANSLKIEANHNRVRLKSFRSEVESNKIFDNEREKALAEFLEEQEKWDLFRERGLQEYRKEKRSSSISQSSSDYLEYLEEKESEEARYERSRQIHVNTRNQVLSEIKNQDLAVLESVELGLSLSRPRYELRKRGANKWVGSGGKSSGASSGSAGYVSPPPVTDYMPAPDIAPAPPAYDVVDDSQYIPPPTFDSNTGMPYDGSGMPGEISIPPPPPPPTEYDF